MCGASDFPDYPGSFEHPLDDDNIDDADGASWSFHSSGPDDDEIERFYSNEDEELKYSDISYKDYELTPRNDYRKEKKERLLELSKYEKDRADIENSPRAKKIVEWLIQSNFIKKIDSTDDTFYLTYSIHGRRENGDIVNVLDWLLCEGFSDGVIIGEYKVSHIFIGQHGSETLVFSKICPNLEIDDFDDDIPF